MVVVKKLAVLVSGTGTNLEAMIEAGVPIALVIADRPCRAMKIAHDAEIPALLVERKIGKGFDRAQYTGRVTRLLQAHHIDLIAMAGFMTILDKSIFVPILEGDTEVTLHERIKEKEREIYPRIIMKLCRS